MALSYLFHGCLKGYKPIGDCLLSPPGYHEKNFLAANQWASA